MVVVSVYQSFPSGAWQVSDIVGGYLTTKTYYGYTRSEAVRKFRAEVGREGTEMSRNACAWCGTEVDDERQYESRICEECYREAYEASQEEIGVEEARNNAAF